MLFRTEIPLWPQKVAVWDVVSVSTPLEGTTDLPWNLLPEMWQEVGGPACLRL